MRELNVAVVQMAVKFNDVEGNLVAISEWSEARIKAGKPKADQIRETGAKVVVTSCDNCRHQITELNEHYNLGIKVTSLCELTVQALVIPESTK